MAPQDTAAGDVFGSPERVPQTALGGVWVTAWCQSSYYLSQKHLAMIVNPTLVPVFCIFPDTKMAETMARPRHLKHDSLRPAPPAVRLFCFHHRFPNPLVFGSGSGQQCLCDRESIIMHEDGPVLAPSDSTHLLLHVSGNKSVGMLQQRSPVSGTAWNVFGRNVRCFLRAIVVLSFPPSSSLVCQRIEDHKTVYRCYFPYLSPHPDCQGLDHGLVLSDAIFDGLKLAKRNLLKGKKMSSLCKQLFFPLTVREYGNSHLKFPVLNAAPGDT
ncbi:hypothetical protein BaRGS_00010006 [Batillaria attramentaria]|uniref:Uncharacterized protein n=1 Tax=Batillaria attramentaria TaxID=370345 RepID=A0ABD0LH41_9CAEN